MPNPKGSRSMYNLRKNLDEKTFSAMQQIAPKYGIKVARGEDNETAFPKLMDPEVTPQGQVDVRISAPRNKSNLADFWNEVNSAQSALNSKESSVGPSVESK